MREVGKAGAGCECRVRVHDGFQRLRAEGCTRLPPLTGANGRGDNLGFRCGAQRSATRAAAFVISVSRSWSPTLGRPRWLSLIPGPRPLRRLVSLTAGLSLRCLAAGARGCAMPSSSPVCAVLPGAFPRLPRGRPGSSWVVGLPLRRGLRRAFVFLFWQSASPFSRGAVCRLF